MKINKLLAGLVAAAACSASMAGTILTEGFDNVGGLAGKGWTLLNLSSPIGPNVPGWFQGNDTVFAASSGPSNSYLGANFLSGEFNAGGTIDDWALTPVLALAKTVRITFDLRLLGENFLDTVQVYLSTNGASSTLSDFTPLATYASSTDTGWLTKTVDLSNISSLAGVGNGRLAFRYTAANTDFQGDYIGIDSLLVVPEPGSLALTALALAAAGSMAHRRRAAAPALAS